MSDRPSLDAAYFDGIFAGDDDPWALASSRYEADKFAETCAALADRSYHHAFEIGCAQGILTARLAALCDHLLAIDISELALTLARRRVGDRPGVAFRRMAFPAETPDDAGFDLVIVSEVAYYWSLADLDRAGVWLRTAIAPGGRIILVHYTGETDYPHTADEAVDALWSSLSANFLIERAERHDRYRLDLWRRR